MSGGQPSSHFGKMLGFVKFLFSNPIALGIAYISSIFLFAAFYSSLDRAFVQSTYKHEKGTVGFRNAIAEQMVESHVLACPRVRDIFNDEIYIFVQCFDGNQDTIYFYFTSSDFQENHVILRYSYWSETPPFKGDLAAQHAGNIEEITGVAGLLQLSGGDGFGGYSTSTPTTRTPINRAQFEIFLEDSEIYNLMNSFRDEVNGIISAESGNYFRMLYFSAVTATTLGYGDIVPITQVARNAITLQSILGLCLIGFFLNSIKVGARKN